MGDYINFSTYALIPLLFYACYALFLSSIKPTDALDVLPWVGLPKGIFAKFRARFSPASSKDILRQAFEQYNQKGFSFVFQTFLGAPYIVLPASQAQWIIDQPDDVLSFKDATVEQLSLDATHDPIISINPTHHDVIKGNLTRALGFTATPVMEELQESFRTNWGEVENEWTDHNLWDSMTNIFAQASGRIFLGLPLCRSHDFLANVVKYAELVVSSGVKIRGLPPPLRPLLTNILTRPNRQSFDKIYVNLAPVVDERKRVLFDRQHAPNDGEEEPFDLLQWLIRRAYQTGSPGEIETVMICKRFALVCFAAIHTTSLTSTNLILDIAAADAKYNTVANLREEVLDVQRQCNGKWDKSSLAKLVQLDSTIRESQRMHGAGIWGLHRKVTKKDGVRLPDGHLAPEGSHVAILGYDIQRDAENYKDPEHFDPFRFSRSREGLLRSSGSGAVGGDANASSQDRASQILKDRNYAAVSTGLTHLPFGHGRHACPGRFFAIQEVKLMLVHVLLSYDIKPLEERPPNPWLRDVMTPCTEAMISVRRKPVLEA